MQDQQKWRDRFEVSLDNRQIFLLFAASSVVLSLVFALGVVVGKRINPAVAAHPKADPLAMLDQTDRDADPEDLTFPRTLARNGAPPIAAHAQGQKAAGQPSVTPPPVASVPRAKPAKDTAIAAPVVGTAKRAKATPAAPAKIAVPAVAISKPKADRGDKKARRGQKTLSRASKEKQGKAAKRKEGDAAFTLQVSAFQDRLEAQQMVQRLKLQGLDAHMAHARVRGRGFWYRVRVGRYKTRKLAQNAKKQLELAQNQLIAYVSAL